MCSVLVRTNRTPWSHLRLRRLQAGTEVHSGDCLRPLARFRHCFLSLFRKNYQIRQESQRCCRSVSTWTKKRAPRTQTWVNQTWLRSWIGHGVLRCVCYIFVPAVGGRYSAASYQFERQPEAVRLSGMLHQLALVIVVSRWFVLITPVDISRSGLSLTMYLLKATKLFDIVLVIQRFLDKRPSVAAVCLHDPV